MPQKYSKDRPLHCLVHFHVLNTNGFFEVYLTGICVILSSIVTVYISTSGSTLRREGVIRS